MPRATCSATTSSASRPTVAARRPSRAGASRSAGARITTWSRTTSSATPPGAASAWSTRPTPACPRPRPTTSSSAATSCPTRAGRRSTCSASPDPIRTTSATPTTAPTACSTPRSSRRSRPRRCPAPARRAPASRSTGSTAPRAPTACRRSTSAPPWSPPTARGPWRPRCTATDVVGAIQITPDWNTSEFSPNSGLTVPPNTAPVAVADAYGTPQDTALNVAAPGVLGNDTDADLDPLTAVLDTDVSHGSLALSADGSFGYTPTGGYSGPDSFTYHASDGTAGSNVVTVSLTVTAPATFTLSGTVTRRRHRRSTGAIVYVFDATTAAYVGNTTTGPPGAYSISLPPGSYKLWIQTNVAGYPDQCLRPAARTRQRHRRPARPPTRSRTSPSSAPRHLHPVGHRHRRRDRVEGAFVYVFDAATAAYVGATTMGPGGAYSITPARRAATSSRSRPTPRATPTRARRRRHRRHRRRPGDRQHRRRHPRRAAHVHHRRAPSTTRRRPRRRRLRVRVRRGDHRPTSAPPPWAPAAPTASRLPAGQLQALDPDQRGGLPRPVLRRDGDFANATDIPEPPPPSRTSPSSAPPTFTLVGHRQRGAGDPRRGRLRVRVRRGDHRPTSAPPPWAPAAPTASRLPAGQLQALDPDQRGGLPRPVVRRRPTSRPPPSSR